jgi:hypothetical protein
VTQQYSSYWERCFCAVLVIRRTSLESPASKDVNTEVEGSVALKPLQENDWRRQSRQRRINT